MGAVQKRSRITTVTQQSSSSNSSASSRGTGVERERAAGDGAVFSPHDEDRNSFHKVVKDQSGAGALTSRDRLSDAMEYRGTLCSNGALRGQDDWPEANTSGIAASCCVMEPAVVVATSTTSGGATRFECSFPVTGAVCIDNGKVQGNPMGALHVSTVGRRAGRQGRTEAHPAAWCPDESSKRPQKWHIAEARPFSSEGQQGFLLKGNIRGTPLLRLLYAKKHVWSMLLFAKHVRKVPG